MRILTPPIRRQRQIQFHKGMLVTPFSGAKLFHLKATHGLPLEVAIDMIMNTNGLKIDWPGFIDTARQNDWWDFQIVEAVELALQDGLIEPRLIRGIVTRVKDHILKNKHPKME